MARRIGIDFGTGNCRIAVMEGRVPEVIRNRRGEPVTPSAVSFPDVGEPMVGEDAKQYALLHPRDAVLGVKRLIGRTYGSPEVEWARSSSSCQLVEAPNGDVHVRVGSTTRSPVEIASHILRDLKASAEESLAETVDEAVFAVPSYFGYAEREAIEDAGRMAGLKVRRLIGEAPAAALTYGFENPDLSGRFVAVVGLGAGFFDLAIIELADGLFQVRAVGADTWLGGEDFDRRVIDWLLGEYGRGTSTGLAQDRVALQRLKEIAEIAKCELSATRQTEIDLPFLSGGASGSSGLRAVLTRQKYEELTNELLERANRSCQRCLADAGMGPEQIDEVLLVGGQARSPGFREMIRKVFGRAPKRAAHDGVVAMGAAIQAGIIQGEVGDLVLLDVTPHTLGIETEGGSFTTLIERNTTIPTRKSRLFTTVADRQTRVEVQVLHGESDLAKHNLSLARFELTDIPPVPKGLPQIEVTFEIDINGIVSVSATDQATSRAQGVTIRPSGGPSPAEPASTAGSGEGRGLALVPVVPYTLGVETEGGCFSPLIARGSRLPARQTRVFATVEDNQSRIEVQVLGGESDMAAYNKSLAGFEFAGLTGVPKDSPRIEITIAVDEDGLISVSARDRASDRTESTVIPPSRRVRCGVDWARDLGPSRAGRRPGIRPVEVSADLLTAETSGGSRRLAPSPGSPAEDDSTLTSDALQRTPHATGGTGVAPLGGEVFMTEGEALVHYLSEEERQQAEMVSAVRKIYRLNTTEKLMLAIKGTREERTILMRDPNRLVATAVLGSPRITEPEIEAISGMKSTRDDPGES